MIKDEVDTTCDMRVNTVRLLCSLDFSVICWVFVRVSFLQNLKKSPGNLSLTEGPIALNIRFTTQPSDLSDCVFLHNRTTPLGPNDLTSLP